MRPRCGIGRFAGVAGRRFAGDRVGGLALVIAVAFGLISPPAPASCFATVLSGNSALAAELERDPKAVSARLEATLAQPSGAPSARGSTARLYALIMEADEEAGRIVEARAAGEKGLLALTPSDGAPLRRWLELTRIKLLEQEGQIGRAAMEYERASSSVPDDAPELVCVLGDRAYLRFLADRKLEAAQDVMRAYQLASSLHYDEVRLAAGQLLARLYSQYGLYDEALALAGEAVDFYTRSPGSERLSDAYLFRADVLLAKHDYAAAETDLLKSRSLLESLGDPVALSFTKERLCMVAAARPHQVDSPEVCRDALAQARDVRNPATVKAVLASLGQIDFAKGQLKDAVRLWDQVLAQDGSDIPKAAQTRIYGLRGEARAALGDPVGALADRNHYIESLERDSEGRSLGQVALLETKFAMALKDEELALAHTEARAGRAAASRQALIRDLVAVSLASVLLLAMVVFGAWSWHRRKLAVDARRAAEERLATTGRLTGGIAHDFNNLLGVLQQAMGLLARRDSVAGDPVALDLVQQARQASDLGAGITAQLLSFARQQHLKPEAIEMSQFLKDVRPLLDRAAGPAMIIESQVEAPAPTAWADRRQLTAALLNLVTNARDATSGDGKLGIRVCQDAGRRVRIDVTDAGSGMAPEVLKRAVEPFYSTKPVGKGSGLGLSMVEGFATQSGGSLSIESEPQRGTTVTLRLPADGAHTHE